MLIFQNPSTGMTGHNPVLLRIFFFLLWGSLAGSAVGKEPFRIVGYLPEYRFKNLNSDHAGLLTDLILFASEPTETGELKLGRVASAPWETLYQIREQHGTKLHLCLGGWGKSDAFSKVVQNEQARTALTSAIVAVLRERKLNGLDIDWEYPRTDEEWDGYLKLLTQLKAAFAKDRFSLWMTVAPWHKLPAKAWQTVDAVQLMSYDYGQKHSTLEQAQNDLQSFVNQRIPNQKIVLGMPFYGRHIVERKATIYAEIAAKHQPAADVDLIADVFFNGRTTIAKKTESALDAGAAGVMVWEIGQDARDQFSLLRQIDQTVKAYESRHSAK